MATNSRTCPLDFFLFILLFVTYAKAQTEPLNFDTSLLTNCYTSLNSNCSFLNPAFWNGTAPSSPEDVALLIYNDTQPVTLYITNSTLNISSITISGVVTLDLQFGSLLEVVDLTLLDGADLIVSDRSIVHLPNGTADVSNATIILSGALSTYTQQAGWLLLNNMSAINAHSNTTLSLASAAILGDLNLDYYSNFYANKIVFNKSQSINAASSFNSAVMNSVSVNFTNTATIDTLVSIGSAIFTESSLASSAVVIKSGGSLFVSGDLQSPNVTASAPVTVNGNLVAAYASVSGQLTVHGSLQASNFSVTGAITNAHNGVYSDYLLVSGGASLIVDSAFYVSTSLNITNTSSIFLQNVQASINSTTMGSGNILVNTSTITLNSSYSLPNAQLTFEGISTLTAPTVDIYSLLYADNSSLVNLFVSNGIMLNQSVEFRGSITMLDGTFNAVGSITIDGKVAIAHGTANLAGVLTVLGGLYFNNTVFTVGSQSSINTTNLIVNTNSTLSALFVTSIYAPVINNGLIVMNANNRLSITGKYTQAKSATLQLNGLNRGQKLIVTVAGTASIAGTLSYDPIVIASGERINIPALVTSMGLNGQFNKPTRAFENILYTDTSAQITFSESNTSDGEKLALSLAFVVGFVFSMLFS
eukprot:Phypoly_transcript_04547.p1 GENE.Phypoly_transcript_04547~~Phypoly_transcript_04547.p1  ORF type:complete len:646 (+),score=70.98 Phypoly_transcript_04547:194-2131(+)